jgi:hypothetical protein
VRRQAGPWTPSVHLLLRHLERVGFDRAPRALGFDARGREVLSFLPGETVGTAWPWPPWLHDDGTLRQVAHWARDLHRARHSPGRGAEPAVVRPPVRPVGAVLPSVPSLALLGLVWG